MAVATIASAAMSAAGQMQAASAQKKMANYNAQVAQDTANYQAARQQDKVRRLMAGARVAVNKSGLHMSGSPLNVITDSAVQSELDHQSILRRGETQADIDRMQGSAAQQAGYFRAATSLLSAANHVAGNSLRSARLLAE